MDRLLLGADAPLQIMMFKVQISLMREVPNGDAQLVAGKILIDPGAKGVDDLAKCCTAVIEVPLAEEIGAQDIIILLFRIFKGGSHPFQAQPVTELLNEGKTQHIRPVGISLLSLKDYIKAQAGGIIRGKYRGSELFRLRDEVESCLGEGAQQLQAVLVVGLPGE